MLILCLMKPCLHAVSVSFETYDIYTHSLVRSHALVLYILDMTELTPCVSECVVITGSLYVYTAIPSEIF